MKDLELNFDVTRLDQFIKNEDLTLESLFKDFDDLYAKKNTNNYDLLNESNESNMQNQIKQQILADMKKAQAEANQKPQRKLTPEEEKIERKKQILIAQKMRQEIMMNVNNSNDPTQVNNIANDPRSYALQSNRISTAMIPREYRQQLLTSPQQFQQKQEEPSMGDKVLYAGKAMGHRMSYSIMSLLMSQLLIMPLFASSGIQKLGGFMTHFFGSVANVLVGGTGIGYITKWLGLGNTAGTLEANLFDQDTGTETVYVKRVGNKILLGNRGSTGEFYEDRSMSVENYSKGLAANNVVNNTIRERMNGNQVPDPHVGGMVPCITPEKLEALRKNPTSSMSDGQVMAVRVPIGSLQRGFDSSKIINSTGYLVSQVVGYTIMAVIAYFIVRYIYRWLTKKNETQKKQEYSTVNNVPVNEITTKMLCEYFEDDAKYFREIQLLDEGIGDWIKNILPTPTNLLKLVNKGALALIGANRAVEVALENGNINALTGRAINVVLAVANLIMVPIKWVLTGILKAMGAKDSNPNAVSIHTINEALATL